MYIILLIITIIQGLKIHQTHESFDHLTVKSLKAIVNLGQMNPEFEYKFYTSTDREKYIFQHCRPLYDSYNKIIPGAYKSDIFRLCVLYIEGGIYIDHKSTTLIPFNKWIDYNKICIFQNYDESYGLHNAFIYAPTSKIEFLRVAMDLIIDSISKDKYEQNHLDITGPSLIMRAFNKYFGNPPYQIIEIGIYGPINVLGKEFAENYDEAVLKLKSGTNVIQLRYSGYYEDKMTSSIEYQNLYSQRKIYNKYSHLL